MLRMFPIVTPLGHKKEKKVSETQRDEAKEAAYAAQPRVYTLSGIEGPNLEFIAVGCQGTANDAQAKVAAAIHESIRNGKQPSFILLLGDNLYPKGVTSPRSSQFDTSFQKPYRELIAKHIPFFIITGNHDYNMRDEARFLPASKEGVDQILNEVAYSYLPDDRIGNTDAKIKLYTETTLDLTNLPAWNMPARYYALDAGDTRILCLDSSTYIADYLLTKDNSGQTPETNQALWLKRVTQEAKEANKQCILATHHPIYSPGKRAFKNDLRLYLSKEQRLAIRKLFPDLDKHSSPYNAYLSACLKEQNLQYDFTLTAHDHNQYYYNDGTIKQLTLGGGGGPLQPRLEFEHQADMGCFIKDYGYGAIKTKLNTPTQLKFSIHPLHQPSLFFSTQGVNAKQSHLHDEQTNPLITAVKQAVNQYFQFIATKQTSDRKTFLLTNLSHGHREIECAHQAWHLVNAKEIPEYALLTKSLYALVRKTEPFIKEKAEHAFSRILDQALSDLLGEETSLKNLAKNISATKPRRPGF